MKKKILFLTPLPPPNYGSALSSKMCLDILKQSKKFEVRSIKLNYSKTISDVGKINLSKIKGIRRVSKQIKKEIKEFKPDIVYFVPATSGMGLIRDYYFSQIVKKYFSGKLIYHIRSRISERNRKNLFYKNLYLKMFKEKKAIILGKELKKDVKEFISPKNIFILPNALENELSTKKFNQIIRSRNKRNSFNLLFLSNMDESKGWFKSLQACKLLKQRKINFHCNFVGEWKNRGGEKKFNEYVKLNSLQENVSYLGKKIGKEKQKILENSDILLFPTEYPLETFGRVILEGMMYGLPVIANRIATIPSTIKHNKTGFLLKKNTSEEIVNYILKLRNKKIRKKIGKEARKRFLKKYEIEKYKKAFIEILKKI